MNLFIFSWVFKIFIRGFKRDITETDLCEIEELSSKNVNEKIETLWKQERNQKSKEYKMKKSDLLITLLKCFKREIILQGLLIAAYELIIR